MTDLNQVTLMGRLTDDPKSFNGKSTVAKFSIAINKQWKDQSGEQHEKVSFIKCNVFGKFGEWCAGNLSKGFQVIVSGELEQNRWEDQQGDKHSEIQVNVDFLRIVSKPRD